MEQEVLEVQDARQTPVAPVGPQQPAITNIMLRKRVCFKLADILQM
jgi:hypothetical protein